MSAELEKLEEELYESIEQLKEEIKSTCAGDDVRLTMAISRMVDVLSNKIKLEIKANA